MLDAVAKGLHKDYCQYHFELITSLLCSQESNSEAPVLMLGKSAAIGHVKVQEGWRNVAEKSSRQGISTTASLLGGHWQSNDSGSTACEDRSEQHVCNCLNLP